MNFSFRHWDQAILYQSFVMSSDLGPWSKLQITSDLPTKFKLSTTTELWADRWADRQTHEQRDQQTDEQRDEETDGQNVMYNGTSYVTTW